jgi:chemotaxis protein MotB
MSAAVKLRPESEPIEELIDFEEGPPKSSKPAEEGEGPWLVSYADLMTLLMGFFALIASMSTPDTVKMEEMRRTAVNAFGGKLENPYDELAGDIMKFIEQQNLGEKVQVAVSLQGIEMTFQGTLFFDSGDFRVKKDAFVLMRELAQVINKKAAEYRVLIEGHTDSVPINHPIISSNWELSGLRASRIAQIFESTNFSKDSLTIIGWGETRPIVQDYDENGDPLYENMSKNRRVVIRVYDKRYTNDPVRH